MKKIIMFVLALLIVPVQTVQAQTPTFHRPVYKANDESGIICVDTLGYMYPNRINVSTPIIRKGTGITPCSTNSAPYVGGHGLSQSGSLAQLTPADLLKMPSSVIKQSIPYSPTISDDTWRILGEGTLDPTLKKLKIIGDWNVTPPDFASQLPDSPADLRAWKNLEVANEIGKMSDEQEGMIIELSVATTPLWSAPSKMVGQSRTMLELCPAMAPAIKYQVKINSTFPLFDFRVFPPFMTVWTFVEHVDPAVEVTCDMEMIVGYSFIEQADLLAGVPASVRLEAETRAYRNTRLWPTRLELEPVGGGVPVMADAKMTYIVIGAVVIICIIVIVLGQPQLILIAAAAA